jgi:hypothetical protein
MYRSSNGSVAGQYSYSGSDAQFWTKETAGSYVKFKNKATGLYLDGLGTTTNGADLGQWGLSNSNNQQWTLTNVGSARISDTLSAGQINGQMNNRVLLYPNPFKSKLNVIVDNPDEVKRIVIFDMMGKQVEIIERAAALNAMSIGASLQRGTYVVQVHGADWIRSFKVTKMN